MPKIKHIAMTTSDPDKAASFYKEVFGMEEVGRSGDSHVYLSDGELNLTIRSCKDSDAVDVGEQGAGFSGIHHIGFLVEDVEGFVAKVQEAGGKRLTPAMADRAESGYVPGPSNVEAKVTGPDGVVIDVSTAGWLGISQESLKASTLP